MDVTSPAGARRLSTLGILLDTLDDPSSVLNPALMSHIGHFERALISGLLLQQPHSLTSQLYAPPEPSNRHAVQNVLAHIESSPGSQYTIGDLAAVACVGARQLQNLFQQQFGMTPLTFIRHIRLEGVRRDLQKGDQTTKVGDVAFCWGFNHLGRFASHYERKFGETPSRTLRAAIGKTHDAAPPLRQPAQPSFLRRNYRPRTTGFAQWHLQLRSNIPADWPRYFPSI